MDYTLGSVDDLDPSEWQVRAQFGRCTTHKPPSKQHHASMRLALLVQAEEHWAFTPLDQAPLTRFAIAKVTMHCSFAQQHTEQYT